MINWLKIALASFGAVTLLGAAEQIVVQQDFENKPSGRWSYRDQYNMVPGHTGKGALFVQENLSDFSEFSDVAKMGSLETAVSDFPSEKGAVEFWIRPYFNQVRAYPNNPNNNLKLYYLFSVIGKPGTPPAVAIYIAGDWIQSTFYTEDGKSHNLAYPVNDWRPREWQHIRFAWDKEHKSVSVNGKASTKAIPGALLPAKRIQLGGTGSSCSLQGVMDEFKLVIPEDSIPPPPKSGVKPKISTVKQNVQDPKFFGFTDGEQFAREWEVVGQEGGEGFAKVDSSVLTSGGKPSLKIVKTNAKGYLLLRRKAALTDTVPDATYRLSARYHNDDAKPNNLFCIRLLRGDRNPLTYDPQINSGWTWRPNSYIRHTLPDEWVLNYYYFQGPKGDSREIRPAAILGGAPCTLYMDGILMTHLPDPPHKLPYPDYGGKYKPLLYEKTPGIPETEMLAHVKNRKPATIEIRRNGRSNQFLLNGKPDIPVLYFVQAGNPRAHYGEMYHDADVKLFMPHLQIGGNPKAKLNVLRPDGKYDFKNCDAEIISALRRAPDASLILKITVGAYHGLENTPDEIWQNRDGFFGVSNIGDMLYCDQFVKERSGKQQYYPSYASQTWRKIIADAAVAYIQHLRDLGIFNAFAGFQLTVGEDGQFLTTFDKRDFSPAARRGFSAYLRKKYGTVEQLRTAWHDPKAEFDFPTRESLPCRTPENASRNILIDPALEMPYLDAVNYHEEMQLETANYFSRRISEAARRPFFRIVMTPGGLLKSWVDRIASGETEFDAFRDAIFYGNRKPGLPAANTTAYDTARYNGTLCIDELDLRTWLSCDHTEQYGVWVGASRDPKEFKTILRKITGLQIAKEMGFWYYDMNQYFAQGKELHAIMRASQDIYREVAAKPDTFTPDVAVVIDHDSIFRYAWGHPTGPLIFRFNESVAKYLAPAGVPYDLLYLRDFLRNPDRVNYKFIVFYAPLMLDAQARTVIDKLKKDGRTLVWLYPAGLLSPEQPMTPKNAESLMGIRVAPAGDGTLTFRTEQEACVGFGDYLNSCSWDFVKAKMPRFAADDPKAKNFGYFLSDDKPAAAVREYPDWRSIFIGAPDGLSSEMFNRIARKYGCFVAVDQPGLTLAMRDNFMSLHALRRGTFRVSFPTKGNIVDADTGQILGKNTDSITLDMEVGDTRWLLLR